MDTNSTKSEKKVFQIDLLSLWKLNGDIIVSIISEENKS